MQAHTKREKETRKKLDRLDLFVLAVFIAIFVVVLAIAFIPKIRYKLTHFSYDGLNYSIKQFGKFKFYHTGFTVKTKARSVFYNLYLRNDPRSLEDMLVNLSSLKLSIPTYLSFQPDVNCSNFTLASIEVGKMLAVLGVKVKGALLYNVSNLTREVLIKNCSNTNFTVIGFALSDKPMINVTDTCVMINAKCEDIVKAYEAFILSLIRKFKKN